MDRYNIVTELLLVATDATINVGSILPLTDGQLGTLAGGAVGMVLLLGPLYYVKFKNVKIKNAKPLLIEPSGWPLGPALFFVTILVFIIYSAVVATPIGAEFIEKEVGGDTFIGTMALMVTILIAAMGPVVVYAIYVHLHYKKIIEYNTDEWKKIKAERKLSHLDLFLALFKDDAPHKNKTAFKQISLVWVVLLTFFTAGIYILVWLARQRGRLPDNVKKEVPDGQWIAILLLSAAAFTIPLGIIAMFAASLNAEAATNIFRFGWFAIWLIAYMMIAVWMIKVVMAINNVLSRPQPWLPIVLLAVFCPYLLIAYEQHQINQSTSSSKIESNIATIAAMGMILSVVLYGVGFSYYVDHKPKEFQFFRNIEKEATAERSAKI